MKKVLITGINGSIGQSLAHYLLRKGYDVYGTIRPGKSKAGHSIPPDKIVYMDLREVRMTLPDDIHAVVHCAAATSENTISKESSKKININGTRRLMHCCIESGVRKFVFISSMSAQPDNPSGYAQSKLGAEKLVLGARGIDPVILRPGLVITDSGKGIFNKMLKYIRTLPVVPVIGTKHKLSTVSINDLCQAISEAMENPKAVNQIIEVGADESLSLTEIVKGISVRVGESKRCLIIPYGLAFAAAAFFHWLGKPVITTDNVYGLKYAKKPDIRRLEQILGMKAGKFEQSIQELNIETR